MDKLDRDDEDNQAQLDWRCRLISERQQTKRGSEARVIVAAEFAGIRNFLRQVVEQHGEATIVGEAESSTQALTLARNLRPDVVFIDCYLPHVVGLHTIPLSRIGGLDIAETIFEQVPSTRVVLLSNLDAEVLPEQELGLGNVAFSSSKTNGSNAMFTLQELYEEALSPGAVIFANVAVKQQVALRQKVTSLSDKAIFFGGLGIFVGWLLTITMIFAPAGVPLALAGVVTLFLGLAGKLIASLRRRLRRKGAKPQEAKRRVL